MHCPCEQINGAHVPPPGQSVSALHAFVSLLPPWQNVIPSWHATDVVPSGAMMLFVQVGSSAIPCDPLPRLHLTNGPVPAQSGVTGLQPVAPLPGQSAFELHFMPLFAPPAQRPWHGRFAFDPPRHTSGLVLWSCSKMKFR